MPNTKRTKNKPKQKKKKNQQRNQLALIRQPRQKPQVSMRDVHTICGINDPFCPHARGAKRMDGGKARALAYSYNALSNFATNDANGNSTVLFAPGYSHIFSSGTVNGLTGKSQFTNFINSSPIGQVLSYRIVSCGVLLRYIGAPLYASGTLRLQTYSPQTGVSLIDIDSGLFFGDEHMNISCAQAKDVAISFKAYDDMQAKQFTAPSSTNGTAAVVDYQTNGWNALLVTVIGGEPGKIPFEFELYFNYEVIFDDYAASALLMTPSPVMDPKVHAATTIVSSETRSIVKEGVGAFGKLVVNRAIQGLMKVGASAIGLPALGNFGAMAITVD